MEIIARIAFSLLPVLSFLAGLVFIDSFKLVSLRFVLQIVLAGCIVAIISLFLNSWVMTLFSIDLVTLRRYIAPCLEEILKAICIVYLIQNNKIGFMVDAAISGFAIGAGFAFVENIYYLLTITDDNILLWIIRGFGTALMHAGTIAIFAILTKSLIDKKASVNLLFSVLPGLGFAIAIHLLFNHFVLPPALSTLLLLLVLPGLITAVFYQSEKITRKWLGVGFDSDVELLEMLTSGNIRETRIGKYLQNLTAQFPGELVVDMLCMLRLHLELAIRAKGMLMMRATGFEVVPEPDINAKFEELRYLEKSIGKAGKLAIAPFLRTSQRDLWQLYFVRK